MLEMVAKGKEISFFINLKIRIQRDEYNALIYEIQRN